MPTKYSDFISWYILKIFKKLSKDDLFEDDALVARLNAGQIMAAQSMVQDLNQGIIEADALSQVFANSYNSPAQRNTLPFYFDFKHQFHKKLMNLFCGKNWVDIENEYYQELLQASRLETRSTQIEYVTELNKSLSFLKSQLREYLSLIPLPSENPELTKLFTSDIRSHEGSGDTFTFLNFNYTNTTDAYMKVILRDFPMISISTIFIHGFLNNSHHSLIFGFGDEMDSNYKRLKEINYNGFLDNIKSFGYLETHNYSDLISFIQSDRFDVHLFGHSCGLSDRVMLNMIFEHSNCRKIKPFYHDFETGNDHKVLTQQISRHFNKKEQMREKVVSFDRCQPLPQQTFPEAENISPKFKFYSE